MKIHHELDPRPMRAAAYMPIADQLDALMKGFAALKEQGVQLPDETIAWVENCQAVKARYRK